MDNEHIDFPETTQDKLNRLYDTVITLRNMLVEPFVVALEKMVAKFCEK